MCVDDLDAGVTWVGQGSRPYQSSVEAVAHPLVDLPG
jgi:hypothetical protein